MELCFIFQSGFRILGLAVDFGSKSLFWSNTNAEFKAIPFGFMIHFSAWFPDPWISCRLRKPVFVLVRYKGRVQGNTLWFYDSFFSLVSGSLD